MTLLYAFGVVRRIQQDVQRAGGSILAFVKGPALALVHPVAVFHNKGVVVARSFLSHDHLFGTRADEITATLALVFHHGFRVHLRCAKLAELHARDVVKLLVAKNNRVHNTTCAAAANHVPRRDEHVKLIRQAAQMALVGRHAALHSGGLADRRAVIAHTLNFDNVLRVAGLVDHDDRRVFA